ncbi:MAG TPA: multicopper oxidase domain-containing protein [Actinomycetota bacterium]|nr:multicopper oxidase domain-containing protein [Actinomycetota bacterium]
MSDRTRLMLVWPVAGFFVVIAFGVGLVSMAAFDSSQDSAATSSAAPASQTIEVTLGDLFIEPKQLDAAAGSVTFEVTNEGQTEHNFGIVGQAATEMIPPGQSTTLQIPSLEAGEYKVLCEVAGHAGGGMTATLVVTDEAATAQPGDHAGHGMSGMSAQEMVKVDTAVTKSYPAETKGLGGQPLEPELVDGVKVFELTADEIRWEVEPGKVLDAMAYNGMLPGPQINADIRDRVRVVLHNKLDQPTTLHFHGVRVPNAMDGVPVITQDPVMPGESYTYEFRLTNSGTHMYHPHFNATEQITEGLLGAFVVHDPSDPEVAVDQTLVLNDGPLGFTINGKGFPATAPIALSQGQTLRLRYMNEGLQIHPMHLHGLVQRVVAKDGYPLPQPYDVDTLMVAPGERYDVLVKADAPGVWAFHCHILNHVEGPEGMFGMVTAVIVE